MEEATRPQSVLQSHPCEVVLVEHQEATTMTHMPWDCAIGLCIQELREDRNDRRCPHVEYYGKNCK